MTEPIVKYVKPEDVAKVRALVANSPELLAILDALVSGYSWWEQQIGIDLQVKPNAPTPQPIPIPIPDATPVPSDELWPAHRCDKFMTHGTDDENEIRDAALDACESQRLDCLRFDGRKNSIYNDAVCVHILHWRSPVDGKFKLGSKNFYEQGLRHGVTRYQIEVDASYAARWNKLVVDYPQGSVQFVTKDFDGVKAIIKDRPVFKG